MSTKPRLNDDQERRRMDGLRALARVIARHYLAHPELFPVPTVAIDGAGKDDAMGNAVARADVVLSHKEAEE